LVVLDNQYKMYSPQLEEVAEAEAEAEVVEVLLLPQW
jgi:hypothetical protein